MRSPSAVTLPLGRLAGLRHGRVGALRRLMRRPSGVVALGVLAFVVLTAVLAPLTASHDPNQLDPANRLLGPSLDHWFGTDQLGRDLFSRVLHGGRIALAIAVAATLVALSVGVLWGGIAAVSGRWVDEALMRVAEATMAIPSLLFALIFVAAFGASTESLALIIGALHAPPTARMARAAVLGELTSDYCVAARAYGASRWRILFSEILPNAQPTLIVQAALVAAHAILVEASLSALGLGVQPPEASWGSLLLEGYRNMHVSYSYIVFPGAIIFITVLVLNTLADNLQAVLDVRSDA